MSRLPARAGCSAGTRTIDQSVGVVREQMQRAEGERGAWTHIDVKADLKSHPRFVLDRPSGYRGKESGYRSFSEQEFEKLVVGALGLEPRTR